MRHLLDIYSLSPEEIKNLLDFAENLKEILSRPIPKVPTLRGKTVLLLFYEPSTRTKFSFERACKVLSADTMSFSAKGSSLEKGESLLDTIKNLYALGINLLVIRHPLSGTPHFLAKEL
ncbi:MAG: aspartate carbamoyltransferase, partial [Caldimicrobium sp.]